MRVIHIHPEAPSKPAEGAACNGCGVCCASEPCPVGVLASGRRRGACRALLWREREARYACGLIDAPADYLPRALRWLAPWVGRRARRWVAAGAGCDSSVTVEQPAAEEPA